MILKSLLCHLVTGKSKGITARQKDDRSEDSQYFIAIIRVGQTTF
ncbi:hypothetical protein XaFJ1_GM001836 [Xanthomonas albilineans]|nr:hypothetical protein XaFJ1_GM001836 [Xanthomonas albilineans]